ncbi:Diguanylate cyclase, GGDEF domain [Treponema bryantii]|uniref:Diguanylate cyclase, GGDEF domain n=1 Tax=Treponema bryantii TaxID=163 RepID=A0A1H9DJ56_9SPIR|nr:GGDEF domain-containing protein [Treponema bryantii]SEQ13536.1 Diguanylate cyclase, GGDEF domain [Treponema bryantii]
MILYGHEEGNYAIKKLCEIVCSVFSHSPVFRIGGDEFVVILKGADQKMYENKKEMKSGK